MLEIINNSHLEIKLIDSYPKMIHSYKSWRRFILSYAWGFFYDYLLHESSSVLFIIHIVLAYEKVKVTFADQALNFIQYIMWTEEKN